MRNETDWEVDVRQRVPLLLLASCDILLCQKVRLGFLNVRSLRTLAAFNITESTGTLSLTLPGWDMEWMVNVSGNVQLSQSAVGTFG
jgi:hypothetical protein